ncbi:MAG: phosphate ABC transporter permease PstA [Candidatus Kapabacteria bacterium]|nr:phosphate ABC transporter permease PstA [Candidatus Kapabacteria bacterium]MCS7169197.1 phosphate ABC transporter permease PstA [Candidatus Kapabacteria bacterium]MDW7997678.1 phosphate ABC transporter permease PstA [Bacteroidota bacterium]MDW8224523.1 phosphate ABC transporter permease PstA [Bacteroidota bacterium]
MPRGYGFRKESSWQILIGASVIGITLLAALCVVGLSLSLLGHFTLGGLPHVTWEFLTEAPRNNNTEGGIFPAIYGTVMLVILMSILGVPIGTVTAIYLAEYAREDSPFTRWVRFGVNTLAGVPSIVFGLFGLGFFVQFVGKGIDWMLGLGLSWGKPAIIWAAATLAVLTLPVVIVSVEEALRSVPRELREAALALGATRWQTIRRIVLPHAFTGILTGSILAVSRGAGEVAPIMFVGAAYSLPELPKSLNSQFMELGYHLFVLSTQSPDVEATKPLQYATTVVLLLTTFVLNLAAILLRLKMRKQRSTGH